MAAQAFHTRPLSRASSRLAYPRPSRPNFATLAAVLRHAAKKLQAVDGFRKSESAIVADSSRLRQIAADCGRLVGTTVVTSISVVNVSLATSNRSGRWSPGFGTGGMSLHNTAILDSIFFTQPRDRFVEQLLRRLGVVPVGYFLWRVAEKKIFEPAAVFTAANQRRRCLLE